MPSRPEPRTCTAGLFFGCRKKPAPWNVVVERRAGLSAGAGECPLGATLRHVRRVALGPRRLWAGEERKPRPGGPFRCRLRRFAISMAVPNWHRLQTPVTAFGSSFRKADTTSPRPAPSPRVEARSMTSCTRLGAPAPLARWHAAVRPVHRWNVQPSRTPNCT
jgi:hypothetical protein